MIEIDASFGEGGGQILRSALALSVITGRPMRLTRIRARRRQPGLRPQHLAAVEAAARIGAARVQGASPGSQTLVFEPGLLCGGEYAFDIGTAGSACLLLQTLALPLAFADTPSQLSLGGGTHVPWSPCFHYLAWQWLPCLRQVGYAVDCSLVRAGFYPGGGGRLQAAVAPAGGLVPLRLAERGRLLGIHGVSAVGRLDRSIAERQRARALELLRGLNVPLEIAVEEVDAASPGTFLVLQARFEGGQLGASALGAPHKRAETVADEAVAALSAELAAGGAIDGWLADQLLLPLVFAQGVSELTVGRASLHLHSNAELIRRFLPVELAIEETTGQPARVRVAGLGPAAAVRRH